MAEKKLNKSAAKQALWERGNLSYLLRGKQVDLYNYIKEQKTKVVTVLSSRRFGKSSVISMLAIETCLKNNNSIVKMIAPTQKQIEEIIKQVMRPLLEDCPKNLMPEWKEAKKRYEFPNGSEIQIAATEGGNIESIRGGDAHLAIIDEAAFTTGLEYCIKNVLVPATAITKGKIVLCSTPNYEDPNHTFNTEYALPLEEAGTLKKFTIYDSPMLDEEAIKETIEAYGGVDNPRFQAEFLCNLTISPEKMVIGEFTKELQDKIVKEVPIPPYYDAYVSMDIGFVDFTAVLFAYYDYATQATVIVDELMINGPKLTTDFLAASIKEKEYNLFQYPITRLPVPVYLRVSDNNNQILLNDLTRLHKLMFIPTAKDDKSAQINELKMRLKREQIIIHPRCKNLIYHIKSAKWDKHRKSFMRIPSHPHQDLLGGHCDALDALLYLVRNLQTYKNPYPAAYGQLSGSNVFHRNPQDNSQPSEIKELVGKVMNIGNLKSLFKKPDSGTL